MNKRARPAVTALLERAARRQQRQLVVPIRPKAMRMVVFLTTWASGKAHIGGEWGDAAEPTPWDIGGGGTCYRWRWFREGTMVILTAQLLVPVFSVVDPSPEHLDELHCCIMSNGEIVDMLTLKDRPGCAIGGVV